MKCGVWRRSGKEEFSKGCSPRRIFEPFRTFSVSSPSILKGSERGLGLASGSGMSEGMSERMWEATVKHAKTCEMGTKLYIYRGIHFTLYLNPICQLIKAEVDGNTFSGEDMTTNLNRSYIEKLVKQAYVKWNFLEEVDGFLGTNMGLLTQGDSMEQMASNNEAMGFDGVDLFGDSYGTSNVQIGSQQHRRT